MDRFPSRGQQSTSGGPTLDTHWGEALKDWAALLTAIAAVAWPVVTFVALLVFKRDIRSLIGRVKRGKVLGQEIELSEQVQKLEEVASAARAQLPASDIRNQRPPEDQAGNDTTDNARAQRRRMNILAEAASSPMAAFNLLSAEIESEGRRLLASLGLLKGRRAIPLAEIIRTLRESESVPETLVRSVETFLQVRNSIVQDRRWASDYDILAALGSGFTILDALQAVPHAVHAVKYAGLELYADGAGTKVPDALAFG
jgi:hypothetical protein